METIRNPLLASLPCGTVPVVRRRPPLRVGIVTIFVLIAAVFAFPAEELPAAAEAAAEAVEAAAPVVSRGIAFGAFVAMVWFGSALLHALAEAWAADRAGGEVAAVVLWPVGGRTVVTELDGAGWMRTAAAGPAAHAALCLLTAPAVVTAGATGAFSLTSLPAVSFEAGALSAAARVIFGVNLKLLVVSLLPVPPLGGSRLIRGWNVSASATGREEPASSGRWAMFSLVAGMALTTLGVSWGNAWLTALGALVLACGCVETTAYMPRSAAAADEPPTVGGYDFSEGYTSLERDDSDEPPREPALGPLARWKAKKAMEKRRREREERAAAERRIDRLLEKVGEVGMDGLTPDERAELTALSAKFKG